MSYYAIARVRWTHISNDGATLQRYQDAWKIVQSHNDFQSGVFLFLSLYPCILIELQRKTPFDCRSICCILDFYLCKNSTNNFGLNFCQSTQYNGQLWLNITQMNQSNSTIFVEFPAIDKVTLYNHNIYGMNGNNGQMRACTY